VKFGQLKKKSYEIQLFWTKEQQFGRKGKDSSDSCDFFFRHPIKTCVINVWFSGYVYPFLSSMHLKSSKF
jgi:hypothetical protein